MTALYVLLAALVVIFVFSVGAAVILTIEMRRDKRTRRGEP